MALIVYKKTNGMVHDLRFAFNDQVEVDDIVHGEGDILPDRNELHDQSYKDEVTATELTLETKKATIATNIAKNLPSKATVNTAIDNIASLADAKAFLKKLSLVVYEHIKDSIE